MNEVSGSREMPGKYRHNLRWNDLSLMGRTIACVLFFLLYLAPSHAMSTKTNYPWHLRLLLNLPWAIIALSLLVPRLNRIPVNPHICGVYSVYIGYIVVAVFIPEGQIPEWATAVTIAGLAALMTGPILRGYDRKDRDREASAEQGGEPEPPITRDLRT